jgi:hypothetical protein
MCQLTKPLTVIFTATRPLLPGLIGVFCYGSRFEPAKFNHQIVHLIFRFKGDIHVFPTGAADALHNTNSMAWQINLSGNVNDLHMSAQYNLVTLIPCRYPGVCRMTARTVISRRNVIGRFAGSNYPVMTAHASPGHTAVIESCR